MPQRWATACLALVLAGCADDVATYTVSFDSDAEEVQRVEVREGSWTAPSPDDPFLCVVSLGAKVHPPPCVTGHPADGAPAMYVAAPGPSGDVVRVPLPTGHVGDGLATGARVTTGSTISVVATF